MHVGDSLIAALSLLAASSSTFAALQPVTYTLNPTLSVLTASGTFNNDAPPAILPILPQSLNSLITSYSGTITANRDVSADTIALTGGTISANNSGSYLPPFPAGSPANYGTLTHFPTVDEVGAVRNFAFQPSSATITGTSSFNANLLSALISSGQLDYMSEVSGDPIPGTAGTSLINGNLAFTTGAASVTTSGNIETLTIEIHTPLSVTLSNPNDLAMQLDGFIVATRTVPEPASLTLLGLGAAALLTKRRK